MKDLCLTPLRSAASLTVTVIDKNPDSGKGRYVRLKVRTLELTRL